MNEVQRFFVEETGGHPGGFYERGNRGVAFSTATSFRHRSRSQTLERELVRDIAALPRKKHGRSDTQISTLVMDMGRDQRWGRYEDTYGEDPFLAGELGLEMVKGLQKITRWPPHQSTSHPWRK